jgi:putative tricarboxylic transport membrane protein
MTDQQEQIERRPGERIVLWFLLGVSVFILITALMIPHLENLSSSGAFPIFIALVMMGSTLSVLWKSRARLAAFKIGDECTKAVPFVFPRTVAIFTGILILYILLLEPLHFWVSSFLFLIGSFVFLKGAGWVRSIIIAVGMLVAVYLLFQYIFKVILW